MARQHRGTGADPEGDLVGALPLLQRLQQSTHQQGARLDRRDQTVLPLGVRAVAIAVFDSNLKHFIR